MSMPAAGGEAHLRPVPVAAAEQVAEGGREQAGHGAGREHVDGPALRRPLRVRQRRHQPRILPLQAPQPIRSVRRNPAEVHDSSDEAHLA